MIYNVQNSFFIMNFYHKITTYVFCLQSTSLPECPFKCGNDKPNKTQNNDKNVQVQDYNQLGMGLVLVLSSTSEAAFEIT